MDLLNHKFKSILLNLKMRNLYRIFKNKMCVHKNINVMRKSVFSKINLF